MKQTTNIYILADNSFRMQGYAAKTQNILAQYSKALSFQKNKTKLHVIGSNDKAKLLAPYQKIPANGNPDLAKGLDYLERIFSFFKLCSMFAVEKVALRNYAANVLEKKFVFFRRSVKFVVCNRQFSVHAFLRRNA